MSLSRWACKFLGFSVIALLVLQNVPLAAQQEPANPPQLAHRPAPSLETPGKMKVDVIVTGEDGQPVTGLTQKDFALLDNKKPQPILSFRGVDGVLGTGIKDPPVEVVLLVDVVNTPLRVVADVRNQIEGYLRRNGGQLTQPTSLAIFDDQGVRVLARPTRDGNQLADALNNAEATMHTVLLTTQTEPVRVTLSLNALERITEAANAKSGRTMLIWIGVGWPMLEEPGYKFFQREIAAQFDPRGDTLRHASRVAAYVVQHLSDGPGHDGRASCAALPQLPESGVVGEQCPAGRSRTAGARDPEWRTRA